VIPYDDWVKANPEAWAIYKYAMYGGNQAHFFAAVRDNREASKEALRRIHACNVAYLSESEELIDVDDHSELRHHLGHIEQAARAAYIIAGMMQRAERDRAQKGGGK
jgi:hypothetical protein